MSMGRRCRMSASVPQTNLDPAARVAALERGGALLRRLGMGRAVSAIAGRFGSRLSRFEVEIDGLRLGGDQLGHLLRPGARRRRPRGVFPRALRRQHSARCDGARGRALHRLPDDQRRPRRRRARAGRCGRAEPGDGCGASRERGEELARRAGRSGRGGTRVGARAGVVPSHRGRRHEQPARTAASESGPWTSTSSAATTFRSRSCKS